MAKKKITIELPDGQKKVITLDVSEGTSDQELQQYVSGLDLSQFDSKPKELDPIAQQVLGMSNTQKAFAPITEPMLEGATGFVNTAVGGLRGAYNQLTGSTPNEVNESISKGTGLPTYEAQTEGGQAVSEATGWLAEKGIDVGNTALGSLMFLSKLAHGNGIEDAKNTFSDVQDDGFSEYLGDSMLEAGYSPEVAATVKALPMTVLTAIGFKPMGNASRGSYNAKQADKTIRLATGDIGDDTAKWMMTDPKRWNSEGDPMSVTAKEITQSSDWRNPTTVKSNRPFELEDGTVRAKDPKAISLIRHGFDEGLIPSMRESSRKTLQTMKLMAEDAKLMMGNAREKIMISPLDRVGESLANRFDDITKINKQAGMDVRKASLDLKGKQLTDAEFDSLYTPFKERLEGMGVRVIDTFKRGEKPKFRVEFDEDSMFMSPFLSKARGSLKKLVETLYMGGKKPDAFRLHQLKKTLDEAINWGSGVDADMAGSVLQLVRDTRTDINGVLRSKSSAYAKANDNFSETIGFIEDIGMSMKNIKSLSDPRVAQKIGLQLRKLSSNYAAKNDILNLIAEAERLTKKHNIGYDDDLITLSMFGSKLGKRFALDGDNTFKALTTQAEIDALSQANLVSKSIEGARNKIFNDDRAFEKLFDYIKDLEARKN